MKKRLIVLLIVACCAALAIPALAFAIGGASESTPEVASEAALETTAKTEPDAVSIEAPEAQQTISNTDATQPAQGFGYVDNDGDGACDNYVQRQPDGYGRGQGLGQGNAACTGFVDANGDGICDNCGSGSANCPGYIDADGDGVCDNHAQGCPGYGQGCGAGTGYGANAQDDSAASGYGHHGGRHHGWHR